ncbi:conserved hypothetical protein [Burkholderia cenocepacia]|nr:conserved hypothetical protein [Burkholderia cenocepacia]
MAAPSRHFASRGGQVAHYGYPALCIPGDTALSRCRDSRQWRTNRGLTPMWEFLCTKHTIPRVYLNMTMT